MLFGIIGENGSSFTLGYFSPNVTRNGYLCLPSSTNKEELDRIQNALDEAHDGVNALLGRAPTRFTSGRIGAIEAEPGGATSMPSEEDTIRPRRARTLAEANQFAAEDAERERLRQQQHIEAARMLEVPTSSGKKNSYLLEIPCMDVRRFLRKGMAQSMNSDIICHPDDIKLYDKTHRPQFNTISAINKYGFDLNYNCESMLSVFSKSFADSTFKVNSKMKNLRQYLHDFTYGIEYECWDGRIPTYEAAEVGLIPLRDGSLKHDGYSGYEYATVILSGDKGLAAIEAQCQALKKYTIFNERCSMHIHIGNVGKTAENLERIYRAFLGIQESLYKMFPSCLANTADYKGKNYCSPLPNIPLDKNTIVKFLSDGNELYDRFGRNHPKDTHMSNKWYINSRYHIVNLNNYYYTNRGTIELRVSTPTFNHNKVIALLMLLCEIINCAINGIYYSDVAKLIKERFTGEEQKWMSRYVKHRMAVLSQWNGERNGVKYFENMSNDGDTGTEEELC
jgi:hypothetical protein